MSIVLPLDFSQQIRFAPKLVSEFNPEIVVPVTRTILELQQRKKLSHPSITGIGEGSSENVLRHFNYSAGQNSQALKWNIRIYHGGLQAVGNYNPDTTYVITSNSGGTGECKLAVENFPADASLALITAHNDKPLFKICGPDRTALLNYDEGDIVPATIDVMEMLMAVDALLPNHVLTKDNLQREADILNGIFAKPGINQQAVDLLSNATNPYFTGRNEGLVEEARLKAPEICRFPAQAVAGSTRIIHGPQEGMGLEYQLGSVIIAIDPDPRGFKKIQQVITEQANIPVFYLGEEETPFNNLCTPVKSPEGMKHLTQLAQIWLTLEAVGRNRGINPNLSLFATKQATSDTDLVVKGEHAPSV